MKLVLICIAFLLAISGLFYLALAFAIWSWTLSPTLFIIWRVWTLIWAILIVFGGIEAAD